MKSLLLLLLAVIYLPYTPAPGGGGGGPSYRSHTSKLYNTSTLAKPAGTQDGDVLLALVRDYYDNETPPAGWTLTVSPNGGTGFHNAVTFTRVAASEPADYDGVFQHYADVVLVCFKDCTTGVHDAAAWDDETSGTSHTHPGLTSTGLLVAVAYVDSYQPGGGTSTTTDPAGFTRQAHLDNGGYGGLFVLTKANGGDGSPVTWTVSSTSWCFSQLLTIE